MLISTQGKSAADENNDQRYGLRIRCRNEEKGVVKENKLHMQIETETHCLQKCKREGYKNEWLTVSISVETFNKMR